MRDLRVWFEKTGEARYISHLDLNRFMLRAIRRSSIPVWFTEGYNPHPYITFALPLSLGYESNCESFDIRIVDEDFSDNQVFERLLSCVPPGLKILCARPPKMKQKTIAAADYTVTVFTESENIGTVSEYLSADNIPVVKTTKKGGAKELNLRENIRRSDISACDDGIRIDIRLDTGCLTNINPSLLIDAMLEKTGINSNGYSVRRTGVFDGDGRIFE